MEQNQIHNGPLKERIFNTAISILLEQKLITPEDFGSLGATAGYMFTTEEGQLEALVRLDFSGDRTYYFAAQNAKFMMVNINAEMFEQTVNYMKNNHPCLLSNELPETALQKARREKNNQRLADLGIAVPTRLMTRWEDSAVSLRNVDNICRRALTSFFVIQIACDIGNGNYEEGRDYFVPLLEKFGLMSCLNSKERLIVDGTYSMQDAIDLDWAYEAYWSLLWCLGLIDDVSDAVNVCDCQKAIDLVSGLGSVDDLVWKCRMRSIEEILDMLDLYYRYNWAVNDAKVHPESMTGSLNPSIVIERRRGLEWVVSGIDDWYDISMPA